MCYIHTYIHIYIYRERERERGRARERERERERQRRELREERASERVREREREAHASFTPLISDSVKSLHSLHTSFYLTTFGLDPICFALLVVPSPATRHVLRDEVDTGILATPTTPFGELDVEATASRTRGTIALSAVDS